jgi:hypothetical protein
MRLTFTNHGVLFVGTQVLSSQSIRVKSISSQNFNVELLKDYSCLFLEQDHHTFEMIRSIRGSHFPEIYLKPLFIQPDLSQADHNHWLTALADGFSSGESPLQYLMPITSTIDKLNYSIELYQQHEVENQHNDRDPATRLLRFLHSRKTSLNPIRRSSSLFGYSYPMLDCIFGDNDFQQLGILDYLEQQHLVKGQFVDRVHLCPRCYSGFLNFRETCPKCQSTHLHSEDLIHHFRCGHVSPESHFHKDGQWQCPKCKRSIKHVGVDMDRPGTVHTCLQCQHLFQEAHLNIVCFHCGKQSPSEELQLQDFKEYQITPMGANSALLGVLLSLREALKKQIDIVDTDTFRVMCLVEKSRIIRYQKSQSILGVFSFASVMESISLLGSSRVSRLIHELAAEIHSATRTSDVVTFLNENTMAFLLPETSKQGATIALDRLKERIQKLIFSSVGVQVELESTVLPVDKELDFMQILSTYKLAR